MSAKKNSKSASQSSAKKVKVLYQNLGGVWYAFADMGEEVFFGRVPVKASAQKSATKKTNSEVKTSEAA